MILNRFNSLESIYDDSMMFKIGLVKGNMPADVDFLLAVIKESAKHINGFKKFMKCYEVHKDETGKDSVYFNMHRFIDDMEILQLMLSMGYNNLPVPTAYDFVKEFGYGDEESNGLWQRLANMLLLRGESTVRNLNGFTDLVLKTSMLSVEEYNELVKSLVFDPNKVNKVVDMWLEINKKDFMYSKYINEHCKMDLMMGFLHSFEWQSSANYSILSKPLYSITFYIENMRYRGFRDLDIIYAYKKFFIAKMMSSLLNAVVHDVYRLRKLDISNMLDMQLDRFELDIKDGALGGIDIKCSYRFG